jgi:hypothetical protein
MCSDLEEDPKKRTLPRLEWVTPAVTLRVIAYPSTSTTVKVEIVGSGMDDLVASLGNGDDIVRADPHEHERLVRERSDIV